MTIIINIEELVPGFKAPFSEGILQSLHIDYATNAIHAFLDNKDYIIFHFKNFGWFNDNRRNEYELTYTTQQITIKIYDRSN